MAGYAAGRPDQQVLNAPSGWVGRKTIDTERRVSNAADTRGTEANFTLTFGGFVRACPNADGVVDGTFEYSLTSEVKTVPEPGQLVRRYSRHLVASLRGEVGDDARLKQIELFGSWSIETREAGADPSVQTIPVRQTFRPSSSGEPDWHAMQSAVGATADVSVAAVILWAGEFYKEAETNWTKLNECVEFAFEPPSGTQSLGPNESTQVRVRLRTKAGGLPAPWTTSSINAIGGGTVSPRPAQASSASPSATLTYTAASQPRRGNGFGLVTTSRAGVAEGKWEIAERGPWSGTISYTKVTAWNQSTTGQATSHEQNYREALTVDVTITETVEGSSAFGGGGAAMVKGTARANFTMRNARSGGRLTQCSGGSRPIHNLTHTQIDTGEGAGSGTAQATVGISGDGQYSVSFSPDVTMTTRAEASSQQLVIRGNCQVESQSSASPPTGGSMHVSDTMQGKGTIDPKTPNRLTGRTEERVGDTTRTLTWDLQRR
jgi:hypothetical protein